MLAASICPVLVAGSDDGVYLVDEDDEVGIGFQFVDDVLHSLFELTAVFGAGHDG